MFGKHAGDRKGAPVRAPVPHPPFAQDGRRIVADADQPDPAPLELAFDLLQLNELRLAVGSPGGATVENDQRPTPGAPAMQAHQSAPGIGKLEVGEDLTHAGSDQTGSPCPPSQKRPIRVPASVVPGHRAEPALVEEWLRRPAR